MDAPHVPNGVGPMRNRYRGRRVDAPRHRLTRSVSPCRGVNFFEKYRLQDVGPTRARLAELIAIFETDRESMTIRELQELTEEIAALTDRLRSEREAEL